MPRSPAKSLTSTAASPPARVRPATSSPSKAAKVIGPTQANELGSKVAGPPERSGHRGFG